MFNIYSGFVMPKCKVFDGAYNSEGFLNDPCEFTSNESSRCFRNDQTAKYYWRN